MPFLISTSAIRVAALASLLVLSACGDDDSRDDRDDAGQAGTGLPPELPSPEGAIGSVTGMPAHPGPGTSPIQSVPSGTAADPASSGWTGDAYIDLEGTAGVQAADGMEATSSLPGSPMPEAPLPEAPLPDPLPPQETLADAPPIIIVPELPPADVPPVEHARPPDVPPPRTGPIGTEGATESTTIVLEPDPDD